LKWAFSEAAVLLYAKCADAKQIVERLTKRHGKAKAFSIFAHRIGRCVYYMLENRRAFLPQRVAAFVEPASPSPNRSPSAVTPTRPR